MWREYSSTFFNEKGINSFPSTHFDEKIDSSGVPRETVIIISSFLVIEIDQKSLQEGQLGRILDCLRLSPSWVIRLQY